MKQISATTARIPTVANILCRLMLENGKVSFQARRNLQKIPASAVGQATIAQQGYNRLVLDHHCPLDQVRVVVVVATVKFSSQTFPVLIPLTQLESIATV